SCGICVVECPARAIVLRDRYEDQGRDSLQNALNAFSGPEHGPNVIVFLSQYDPQSRNLVSGLDQKGGNIRTVQVSCIGKMDPLLILRAIEEGADGVVVVACTPGECPYQTGDVWAKKRFEHASRLLSEMGLEAQRVQWLSPSPADEFFGMIEEMVAELKGLGPVFERGS
ncbi:MAG: hydrogenase iron-sulfur subunit, partial [Candidatus Brocadiales bacterium]